MTGGSGFQDLAGKQTSASGASQATEKQFEIISRSDFELKIGELIQSNVFNKIEFNAGGTASRGQSLDPAYRGNNEAV